MPKDFYSILEIPPTATISEIKKAFRKKAVKYHPDKNLGQEDFTKIFIEVKEAYDNLIDTEKRFRYDKEYFKFFADSDAQRTDEQSEERKSEGHRKKHQERKFRRDNYNSFFSEDERRRQDTSQVKPKKTPWGDEINDYFSFFALPKKIGNILGGYSTVPISAERISLSKLVQNVLSSANTLALLFGWALLIFLLHQYWYFTLKRENATAIMLFVYILIFLITVALRVANRFNAVAFEGLNYFIGINGFAIFKCKESRENVVFAQEVNFNDVTDMVTRQGKTDSIKEKWYHYVWFNASKQDVIFEDLGKYDDFAEELVRLGYPYYWLNVEAEKAWTIYLLDTMEEKLEKYGYLDFKILDWENGTFRPYLKLGIGYITFLLGDQNLTYRYENIKRMYTKGNELFIEKDNYEKVLFLFQSGNKNSIPLDSLSNKLFFIRAAEILLGYSIVE